MNRSKLFFWGYFVEKKFIVYFSVHPYVSSSSAIICGKALRVPLWFLNRNWCDKIKIIIFLCDKEFFILSSALLWFGSLQSSQSDAIIEPPLELFLWFHFLTTSKKFFFVYAFLLLFSRSIFPTKKYFLITPAYFLWATFIWQSSSSAELMYAWIVARDFYFWSSCIL